MQRIVPRTAFLGRYNAESLRRERIFLADCSFPWYNCFYVMID